MIRESAGLVTPLGDSAVLLPVSLILIGVLWRFETARAAFALARAMMICLGTIFVLKVIFISCGDAWNAGVVSPSGHACLSATVYGSIAAIAAAHTSRRVGAAVVCIAGLLISAIAVSRLVLGFHTSGEIVLGLGVGALASISFALAYRRLPHPRVSRTALIASMSLCVAFAGAGYNAGLPAEAAVRDMALKLRLLTGVCESMGQVRIAPRPDDTFP